MRWKKLLESVSESLNDHLRLRNDYLIAENRLLRRQIDGRVQLTDSERKELAEMGATLGKNALEELATVAKPATILAWNRKFADHKIDTSEPQKSVGRPRVDQEIETLVIRMARENRSWGYDRIQGALKPLGYPISDQTVGNILKRHRLSPAPERQKTVTWREFVCLHLDVLLATDFFTSEVWSWLGLLVSSLLYFIHLGRHPVSSVSHQTIQAMRSLVRHALELGTYGARELCFVKACTRFQVIRGGEGVLGTAESAWISRDERRPRSHATGKVVFLSMEHFSMEHLRKIRDGPLPTRQRLKGSVRDEHRQAA